MDEGDKGYFDVQRDTPLQVDQIEYIEKNPEGLTIEGCEKKIKDWKRSSNQYTQKMYDVMLKSCKTFTKSGKTADEKVIYSRDKEGNVTWKSE